MWHARQKIKRLLTWTLLALLWGSASGLAAASLQVGIVKSVAGKVTITRDGGSIPSRQNERLYRGDVVETGWNSKAGLILEDDTLISLGPRSRIAIEDFIYHPEARKLSLVTRIFHGTMSFISGRIAKLAPSTVHIITPHGTVGVRGTHVLIRVD